jgi:Na+-translocating ferredoxin:NAD+ oxidoreductase RnfG subunit
MNKRLLKYIIPITVAATTVLGIFILSPGKEKIDYRLQKFELAKIPGINVPDWNKQFKTSPIPHIILKNKDTNEKKYVFSTADCGIIKHGYKNRVELFVVFNSNEKIENVILGKNIETPELITRMFKNGFLKQWNNKSEIREVQYVTGATYSCKAVSGNISELLTLLKHNKFFR